MNGFYDGGRWLKSIHTYFVEMCNRIESFLAEAFDRSANASPLTVGSFRPADMQLQNASCMSTMPRDQARVVGINGGRSPDYDGRQLIEDA